ncbi:BTB/POZ protein [Rhizophagus irregularis DAOM 181602=DAOM 197198]|nr:BTB/POZ protein [Rhizophagus irregularis DAOM 181602=DAOM 197198]
MSIQFFSKLSQNYIEILEDNEYYDVTIEVGEDPNVKIFRAHMIILCHRSSFLRRTITSNKKNNDVLAHIKLSNISPKTFQIILRYLYGGILSLNGQDTLDIFKILIAADELLLHELNKDLILSYVSNMNRAINYCNAFGPSFGVNDLIISHSSILNDKSPFNYNRCKQKNYEKRIRDTEDKFDIEDYEVFQIMKE